MALNYWGIRKRNGTGCRDIGSAWPPNDFELLFRLRWAECLSSMLTADGDTGEEEDGESADELAEEAGRL
jgi:hypothetical protein